MNFTVSQCMWQMKCHWELYIKIQVHPDQCFVQLQHDRRSWEIEVTDLSLATLCCYRLWINGACSLVDFSFLLIFIAFEEEFVLKQGNLFCAFGPILSVMFSDLLRAKPSFQSGLPNGNSMRNCVAHMHVIQWITFKMTSLALVFWQCFSKD